MQIENFIQRLDKFGRTNDSFEYSLGKQVDNSSFETVEKKLNVKIPDKIKAFYFVANGLKTENPNFEIVELNSWTVENGLIHFATFDSSNKVYFVVEINQANEWTILNKEKEYEITLTISSFWSNKIWHWIEQNKRIWEDNWW